MKKKRKDRWLWDFIAKINQDCIGAFSAQTSFFIIISFFPFLMMLLSLSTLFNISDVIRNYFSVDLMPEAVQNMINSIVSEVYNGAGGGVVYVTVVLTIWSASKGVMALMTGLNSVYGIPETRNYFFVRFLSMIYTLMFSIMLIVVIVMLVFGRSIYELLITDFPWMQGALAQIISFRTIGALIALTLFFWILLVFIPKRRAKIFAEFPGAFIAACGWIAFSYLFSYYIDNIGNFSYLYGSLTAIVLFMMWLWICIFILFVGAEINLLLQGKCRLKLVCSDEHGESYGERYKIIHSPYVFHKRKREQRKRLIREKKEAKKTAQLKAEAEANSETYENDKGESTDYDTNNSDDGKQT